MRHRLLKKICCFSLIALYANVSSANIEFTEELFVNVHQQYGEKARKRIEDWQALLDANNQKPIEDKLFEVNRFFNRVQFVDDIVHWQMPDYWATPVELLATNGGDCEDFAIAKYFTLVSMGIPQEKLRLMYVTATKPERQAHMVLAYYESVNSIPLVLDNINKRILPASKRRDLIPIYSFNGEGLWLAKLQGTGRKLRENTKNKLWDDLNKRIQLGN